MLTDAPAPSPPGARSVALAAGAYETVDQKEIALPGHHPARPESLRLPRRRLTTPSTRHAALGVGRQPPSSWLATALAAVTLSVLLAPAAAHAGTRPPLFRTNYIERRVIHRIDAFRRANGLGPLRLDRRLARGADAHTSDMFSHGYFAHDSFSGSWSGRVRGYSGGAHGVGEVIGYLRRVSLRRQARAIVSLWIHSPPHRAVLLGSYARLGVGRRIGNFYGFRSAVFTVDFATR